jgi:hypothetical protein
VGRVAKKIGADVEIDPTTGMIKMVFRDDESAKAADGEDKDRKRWDQLTEKLRGK